MCGGWVMAAGQHVSTPHIVITTPYRPSLFAVRVVYGALVVYSFRVSSGRLVIMWVLAIAVSAGCCCYGRVNGASLW